MTGHLRLGCFYRSLPMEVAARHGHYERHGLEVTHDQVTSSTQQFTSLRDGDYDVVQTSPDNVANYRYNDGNPIGERVDARGFVGMDYGMLLVLVARPGIERVEDLRGRTVSVDAPESGFAYVLYRILAEHGLERGADFDVVSTGGVYDRYQAMMAGADFAATLLSGGFETRAANDGYVLLDSVYDVIDPYLGVWGAAKTRWLDSHPELATGFVAAYRDATTWVFDPDNREACLELLQEKPHTSAELASQLYDVQVRPGVGNVPDASIDPVAVRNVLALREQFDGFEDDLDLDALVGEGGDLVDRRYLEATAAERRGTS